MRTFRRKDTTPRFIVARFASVCPETGLSINKGDRVAYFPDIQKAYHENSKASEQVRGLEFAAAYNMTDANY